MEHERFHVVNLGCKVNKVEADALSARLLATGSVAVPLELAELVVVNTCTVTGEADKKARKAVRHALACNADARVVVTGCAAALKPSVFEEMDERVSVVQRADLLVSLAGEQAGPALRIGEGFRTRVSVKVQDGCDHACTYCIVHVARGPATSVAFQDALAEVNAYLARGVKEIVLAGIDLGSYRDGSFGLSDLVETCVELADKACKPGERPARFRVSSIEPLTIDERFIDVLAAADGRVCRHLHLPLQSGSTKVLSEMNRPYSAAYFADLVSELYERIGSLSLTTDIICGFPGETDAEFRDTLDLAERCRFSKVHVFPYSMREGTPAAARADQVAAPVKSQRCAALRKLAARMRADDLESRRGTRELAIVEGGTALTESYHEITAPEGAVPGALVEVLL